MTIFPLREIERIDQLKQIVSIFFKLGEKLNSKSNVSEVSLEKWIPKMFKESRHSNAVIVGDLNSISPILRPTVLDRFNERPEYCLNESKES